MFWKSAVMLCLLQLCQTVITINGNLNAPVFTQTSYSATLNDTEALGDPIIRVTATDADTVSPNNIVRYRLKSSSTTFDLFFLDAETGDISLKTNLATDKNNTQLFTLVIAAYDLGSPSLTASQDATVFISIVRNLKTPFFLASPYSVSIEESKTVGSAVIQVSATDEDKSSPFNVVTLRAIGDDKGPSYFNFDTSTGVVSVRSNLRLDTDTQYRLRIEARDGGSPALSAMTLVDITVLRNFYTPQFSDLSYETTIMDTQSIGNSILRLTATDQDMKSPHNLTLFYMNNDASSNFASQYFSVKPLTGAVFLRRSLVDTSQISRFTFTARVRDQGVQSRTSNQLASVIINIVRDKNTPNSTAINKPLNTGSQVFQVTAQDADIQG